VNTTEIPTPRLKERYDSEVRSQLQEQFGLASAMAVPRLEKITLNMGVDRS
jgi:large subunit ribosomal protein L5